MTHYYENQVVVPMTEAVVAPTERLQRRPVYLLINAGSGTTDADEVQQAFAAAMAGTDHQATVVSNPQNLASLAQATVRRAQASNGIIAVAGGDGAINAVAQAAWKSGCVMAILPRGTFNFFAKTHDIPLDLEDALKLLTAGIPQPVQVGMINGRIFLVNASIGFYPKLLEQREETKRRLGRNRVIAIASAVMALLRSHRPMRLRLHHATKTEHLRALTLFVGNNPHQLELLGIPLSDAVNSGELAAVLVRPVANLSLLGLLWKAALGQLGDADEVDHFSFRSISVHKHQLPYRGVKVALDGEILRMKNPLEIQVAPKPLLLLKPARPAD